MTEVVRPTILLPADPEHLPIGGIASFVRGFVKFAPPDFEVQIVGLGHEEASRTVGKWRDVSLEGRSVRFLPVARRASSRRGRVPAALTFSAALVLHARDVVAPGAVLQFHRPGTALPLLRTRVPKIRVIHLTEAQLVSASSESRWRRLGPLLRWAEQTSLERMDRIYVVNADAAEDYRRQQPAGGDRIRYLPNWVDDALFMPWAAGELQPARTEMLARHGLPPSVEIVLFAGRLERQKDPELLIAAFAQLRAHGSRAVLLIAGDGSLRSGIEQRSLELGVHESTRFLRDVTRPELAQLMALSDALVITSAHETGPTVAYEALATGLPVVGPAVGALPTLVRGAAGRIVADRSPEGLATGLAAVLAADREAARRAAAAAAVPYRAAAVLRPFYEAHRELAT